MVCVCVCELSCPQRLEVLGPPGTGAAGGWELPEDRTWVLWKSCIHGLNCGAISSVPLPQEKTLNQWVRCEQKTKSGLYGKLWWSELAQSSYSPITYRQRQMGIQQGSLSSWSQAFVSH